MSACFPRPLARPSLRGPTADNFIHEVIVIGKKPGQSVEKRRREREKHLKKMDKLARRREYKEEQERKRVAGEEEEPVNPIDIHLDTDIPPDDPGALAEE